MDLEHGDGGNRMSTTKRLNAYRLIAVAFSCAALTGATLGSALAARNQPVVSATVSPDWASLLRLRHLVAETTGADADELDALNGMIDPDDQNELPEVEAPETETPETETPETETPDTEQDDQGEIEDDQGEDEQDEADNGEAAEHDDGDAGEHDDGDSSEHEDTESGGD
jgi:type IV secretory pathway VirB10-like protein